MDRLLGGSSCNSEAPEIFLAPLLMILPCAEPAACALGCLAVLSSRVTPGLTRQQLTQLTYRDHCDPEGCSH